MPSGSEYRTSLVKLHQLPLRAMLVSFIFPVCSSVVAIKRKRV